MLSLRTTFAAHALVAALFAIFNTGGACGSGGASLPPVTSSCGDGGAAVTSAALRLGTTDPSGAFREIVPNETLSVVHGPQGGEHVWGAARLSSPRAGSWVLSFELKDAAGAQLAHNSQIVDACAGGTVVVTYVTVFLESVPPLRGVLSLNATPLDDAGAPMHDEVAISAQ